MMGTIHLVNDRDIDFAVLTCLELMTLKTV